MNLQQIGAQLIWTIGQVTIVLSVGMLLYLAARRRGPAMRSLFAAATLAIALVMALLVLSPWPRWHNISLAPAVEKSLDDETNLNELADAAKPQAANNVPSQSAAEEATAASTTNRRATAMDDPRRAAIAAFWQSLHDNLATPTDGATVPVQRGWQWPAVLAVIFLAGIAVAVIRLLVGLWAVAHYRRLAAPIDDKCLLAELAELKATIGCDRDVTLCESATVGAPATIGWRKPLVLLPADWRQWNPADRRAVLAHELAHVSRGDYLSGLVARLATALHFYHPLAHWLARRMRFEQELAADACGVACSGGKESYVVALARMALAQDNRALAWAARPFLPNRSTFLRRIEMLRNTTRLEYAPFRPATRRMALAALGAMALLIAGLRGPILSTDDRAQAQQPGAAPAAAGARIDLKGVPEETLVYAVIRPAAILSRDAQLRETIAAMEKEIRLSENAGISPSEVEEFRFMLIDRTVPGQGLSIEPVMVLRTIKPEGWKSFADQWKGAVQTEYRGQQYSRMESGGPAGGWSSFTTDASTLVYSNSEPALKAYIDAAKNGGNAPRWAAEFKRVENSDAAFAADIRFFGKLMEGQMQQQQQRGGGDTAMFLAVAPLWRQTNTLVAGATIDGKLSAATYAICKSEQAAEEVAATVTAARVMAQNMMPVARAEMARHAQPPEIAKLQNDLLAQAEKFLAQVKPTREGNVVSVKVEGTEAFGPLVASLLLPAISKARGAAQRAQSTNNLRQISLAMLNYHDVHKHFPAASILGPDGKTRHSWRVAILPYIEQESLYKQYRFDEPWDSENNKRLLSHIPPVFQHPDAKGKSTNSSYYLLTGIGGIFQEEAAKKGTSFAAIRDGTSNTILAVEAIRDIPWTKPEDIPFDVDGPLPKLGGFDPQGFSAAFADGAVRIVSTSVDAKVLKALFTAGGGEVVSPDQVNPVGARNVPQRQQPPAAVVPPAAIQRK
jgi:beta-lactamase regulating signal transducer with metallopeptidase domain